MNLASGETTKMRRRHTIRIAMLAIVLAGAFIVLRSAASASKSDSCKESIDECCKKKETGNPNKTTWENLSRQFFSSI
jgi:hypothetical protein